VGASPWLRCAGARRLGPLLHPASLKEALVGVFCLILAVSPCSAVLTSTWDVALSLENSDLSPGPFVLRLAGGTGGM
jgi:hypothetical protein